MRRAPGEGKGKAKPAQPRKKPGKPVARAAARRATPSAKVKAPRAKTPTPAPSPPAQAAVSSRQPDAEPGKAPATPATPATPASPPPSAPPASRATFDPATGAWLQPLPPPPPAAVAPDAPRTGTGRMLAWNIILWIDLGFLALNFLLSLAAGAILVFAADSAAADGLRESFEGGSTRGLVVETLLTFTMVGIIPLLWVLFTRQAMWEGTKRYLALHSPAKSVALGIGLAAVLLVGVAVLSAVYALVTEGPEGLTVDDPEGENPAVDAILRNLSWPTALLIAFTSGVGEEILFRGVLYRKLGLWPQAILFGLAHAAGGYLPQMLFAFGMAVLFGYLLRRGMSLWSAITAHGAYNLTLLAISLAYG